VAFGGISDRGAARDDGDEEHLDSGLGPEASGLGGKAGRVLGGVGSGEALCFIGVEMLWRAWSCKISQCSADQSCSGRRAWVSGTGRSAGSTKLKNVRGCRQGEA
jgi:hypothetical protein